MKWMNELLDKKINAKVFCGNSIITQERGSMETL